MKNSLKAALAALIVICLFYGLWRIAPPEGKVTPEAEKSQKVASSSGGG